MIYIEQNINLISKQYWKKEGKKERKKKVVKKEKDEYMGLPSSEITAAERGGDNLNSNLHGLWRTHFHLLHHQ